MGDKVIYDLLSMYDEYLDTLKHIRGFNFNVDEINRINGFSSVKDTDNFLNEGIDESHLQLINEFIKNMLGTINLSDVRDLRTFIYYPDFKVKIYINNPATLYKNSYSIEKAIIISPAYELNLVVNDNKEIKGRTCVLRVKRLALSPRVNVFSFLSDEVDLSLLNFIVRGLIKKFTSNYGIEPNKDDLILLENMAIKYIFDHVKQDTTNGLDALYQEDAFVSYDYNGTKKNMCNIYKVSFRDSYRSRSNINTPWIYRGLVSFDNREINPNRDNSVVPLTYMRTRTQKNVH